MTASYASATLTIDSLKHLWRQLVSEPFRGDVREWSDPHSLGSGNAYTGALRFLPESVLVAGASNSLPLASAITVGGTLAWKIMPIMPSALFSAPAPVTTSGWRDAANQQRGIFSGTLPSNLTALYLNGGSSILTGATYPYRFTGGSGGLEIRLVS